MAIARLWRDRRRDNSIDSTSGDRGFVLAIILLSLVVSSCSQNKLTQCEQIFRIVSQVNDSSRNLDYTSSEDSGELKTWLKAANIMNKAADNIQALHINNGELIKYQNSLATIYRIYSQATYDAVNAIENKSLERLELARLDAQKAGKMQQDLVKDINSYCLNQ